MNKATTIIEADKAESEDKRMTNQEKFIQIFGIDAWRQMVVFNGLAEQFKEYWTSPYNENDCRDRKELILRARL